MVFVVPPLGGRANTAQAYRLQWRIPAPPKGGTTNGGRFRIILELNRGFWRARKRRQTRIIQRDLLYLRIRILPGGDMGWQPAPVLW